ncbi:LOW QUALITY PROTEIN: hypothetical protein YC2023_096039 [Brassica napus]
MVWWEQETKEIIELLNIASNPSAHITRRKKKEINEREREHEALCYTVHQSYLTSRNNTFVIVVQTFQALHLSGVCDAFVDACTARTMSFGSWWKLVV